MTIRFQCGSCSQPIEVDDEWASRVVACPFCRKTVTAPAESTINDLNHIPSAAPMEGSPAPGGYGPPEIRTDTPFAAHPNYLALVALALIVLSFGLLTVSLMIFGFHAEELEALQEAMLGAEDFAGWMKAQDEFYRARGGVPGWQITATMLMMTGGLLWIASIVCGVIAVRRPRRRPVAVTALVIAGLFPVFCCGWTLIPGAGR